MKINGRINVMGIKEVVFKYGPYCTEETKYAIDSNSTSKWYRISTNGGVLCGKFFRTHEQMTRSIKALALNPHAELSFNDGLLIIILE